MIVIINSKKDIIKTINPCFDVVNISLQSLASEKLVKLVDVVCT